MADPKKKKVKVDPRLKPSYDYVRPQGSITKDDDNFLDRTYDKWQQKIPEPYRMFMPGVSDIEDAGYLRQAWTNKGMWGDKALSAAAFVLPVVGSKLLKKGVKAKKAIQLDQLSPTNIDDLLKLGDNEIASITNKKREYWDIVKSALDRGRLTKEQVENELGKRMAHNSASISATPDLTEPTEEVINTIQEGKQKQIDWLNSEEWLSRRMKATGEPESKAKVARNIMLKKLDNTSTKLKNIKGANVNERGMAMLDSDNNPLVYLGVDDKMNDLLNTSNHEFIHASNSGINDYSFKGIDFPTLVSDSKSPGVQSTISYLNKNPEKQVRGVRALQFLKESGKWSSGEVTDDMIDHLRKSSYYGKGLPNDVGNLVTNLDDQNLKKFLNTVYSTVPAYGVAKILSQETNDNMKYKKGNSSKKRYANGGVKDGPTNGFATPYHIPGSYMKEGLIYNADNELMIRDSSNKKYYPLGSDISALRRPDKIKSTERAKNKEFTLGMLQKDYDENVKNLSYPPEKYNIPEYNLGGWIKDNKQGVMGGLTAAAGIGAMFIPGAQGVGASLIGSGINGIAGEVKQDQIAEQQAQANIEAQGSLASPAATNTFKCGGRYKKMANGGLVEWQGGEPLMTPGGKIVRTPKSMPSHANGGVKGFVPDGTAFLGKKRNPETGNTYMQDGDKLGKIQQKADNILKTSGNKLSRNSAILNKKNSIDKFNLLMSKQEAGKSKKMKNGGYKKMANGGDVPPTASTPTTAGAFVGPEAAPAMAPWNQYKDFTAGVTGGMVDSIDPVNDPNQNVGPINVPRVKNTFGTNFGNFMENNGSTLASLAPVAFNAVNAMMPRERERLPYQYNKANAMLADRRFDIRPILRQNRIAQRIGDQNAKILGGGATASNRAVNTASRMGADMNAYSTKNNMENQYRAQQAQGMFQTGAAQRGVDVANLQNEAARRNMLGSSLSQFSNFAQNRELMNNMGDRDLQRLQILSRAYPFYNKQFGDINYG